MKAKFFGVDVYFSFPAVAFLTLAVLCDKRGTVLICLLSSFLHELGHIAVMKITGAKLKAVNFNLGDVAINADLSMLSYKAEFLVNIGGVAVNFMLSILAFLLYAMFKADFFRDLFISNILIGAFNFLPVRYLDGGQIILILLQKRFSVKLSETILNVLTVCFMLPVGICGLLFLFNSSYNYSLLFAVLYLICTLVSKEFKNVS